MFLRKIGRRILLLHSYRDGRGQVRQARLGHFVDMAGLEGLPVEVPERLREQARTLLEGKSLQPSTAERAERIRRTTRTLLNYLAEEEDAEVLTAVAPDLERVRARLVEAPASGGDEQSLRALVCSARSRLAPRRGRYHPDDGKARPYQQALTQLAEVLNLQGRLQESADILAELVGCFSTAEARLAYGAVLQRLGREPEALEQYTRANRGYSYRYYNLAALCWQQKQSAQALEHLLGGFLREPEVVEGLAQLDKGKSVWRGGDYWKEFGALWTGSGRRFAVAVCSQTLVRRCTQRGQAVPRQSRGWLLERGLAAP